MFGFGAKLAVLALFATASAKKSKQLRASCVDKNGQEKGEGSTWNEGVDGCLKLTCTEGVAVGIDNCSCKYPDNTTGLSGHVWYSIPACQTCTCTHGILACQKLENCILASVTTVTAGTSSSTTTSTSVTPTETNYQCNGPDNISMKPGDMIIEGCQNCTCAAAGLVCVGMVACPISTSTAVAPTNVGQCFKGWLGFVDETLTDGYVPNGYVFVETCNRCKCTDGNFICQYTCTDTPVVPGVVTVTVSNPTQTAEPTSDVDEEAGFDCDVGDGIVVNGDLYQNDCGAQCTCAEGVLNCQACASSEVAPTTSAGTCTGTDGQSVDHGKAYMADKCTNCTCIAGTFSCQKVCERECKTTSGEIIKHNKTKKTTCQDCKCVDAKLTCVNKCAGKVCKVPNSKTTIKPGTSKTLNSCTWCRCTKGILLECRNKCQRSLCVKDGRMLKTGKSLSSKCENCTCKNGSLACKKTC